MTIISHLTFLANLPIAVIILNVKDTPYRSVAVVQQLVDWSEESQKNSRITTLFVWDLARATVDYRQTSSETAWGQDEDIPLSCVV